MASSSETARAYFAALTDHDVEAALALWKPGAVDHIVGQGEFSAPGELRGYLTDLLDAFPDLVFELVEVTTLRERCVVRWRAEGTFAGPGRIEGIRANGEQASFDGVDVLTVRDGQITANHVYSDRVDLLCQLGLLPEPGSAADRGRKAVTNLRLGIRQRTSGTQAKVIAPGVWIVQGGLTTSMNVYLLEEPDGGVTLFDAGTRSMTPAVAAAAARLGGVRRVVLGHADCDHRGTAPALGAPVYTHPLEVAAAESEQRRRDYWDLSKLTPTARPLFPLLFRAWDGGAVDVAGTVQEGDQIAGFDVLHFPGHAPGLIGLLREEDGLALCSDILYTVNVETGLPGRPRLPHPAFDQDVETARSSLLRLAELNPRAVWVGHGRPVAGAEVPDQLRRAAQS